MQQSQSITFDEKDLDKKGRPRRAVGSDGLLAGFKIIENGMIEYSFTDQMAGILYEPEQYIWMSLAVQNRFSSKYELNLFENCIRYVGVGTTGFKTVADWQSVLGATEETYDELKRLNAMVIKPATKGVNSKSGILLEPEYEREKRKVARIKFKVAENPQMQLLDYKEHSRIREMDAFKKAREFGLKDVEAIYWIETKGERYVAETLAYVALKKPEKNLAGYLMTALKKGYGEKSPDQRKLEAESAERLEAQKARDAELRERMKEQPEPDVLKAQFVEILGDDGFRAGDFKKRGWESLLCVSPMRNFAFEQFGWPMLDERTFFSDNKLDFERLQKAHEQISESSLYRAKLDDAATSVSGRGKIDLDKIIDRIF